MPDKLVEYLKSASATTLPVAVYGDFNYPGINWETFEAPGYMGQDVFLEQMNQMGFDQLVFEPTHYQGNILDLILISEPNLIQNVKVNSPIPGCDHNPVSSVWVVGTCGSQNHDEPISFKCKFLNANYDALNFELLKMDWSNIFLGIFDVNELWTVYMNIITDLVNKYVPICSFTSHKRSAWSAQVRKLHNRQRYLHKKYKQTHETQTYIANIWKRLDLLAPINVLHVLMLRKGCLKVTISVPFLAMFVLN